MTAETALATARGAKSKLPPTKDVADKRKLAEAQKDAMQKAEKAAADAKDAAALPGPAGPCSAMGDPAKVQAAADAAEQALPHPACAGIPGEFTAASNTRQQLVDAVAELDGIAKGLEVQSTALGETAKVEATAWPQRYTITKCVLAVTAIPFGWASTQAKQAEEKAKAARAQWKEATDLLQEFDVGFKEFEAVNQLCADAGTAVASAKSHAGQAEAALIAAVATPMEGLAKSAADTATDADTKAKEADKAATDNKAELEPAWDAENDFWRAENDRKKKLAALDKEIAKNRPLEIKHSAAMVGALTMLPKQDLYIQPDGTAPAGWTAPPGGSHVVALGAALTVTVAGAVPLRVQVKVGPMAVAPGDLTFVDAGGGNWTLTIKATSAALAPAALTAAVTAFGVAHTALGVADAAATTAAGDPNATGTSRKDRAVATSAAAATAGTAAGVAKKAAGSLDQANGCATQASAALKGGVKTRVDQAVADSLAKGGGGKTLAELVTAGQGNANAAYKAAANAFEIADGSHSVGRHGADVADGPLKVRIQTGVAPDGANSPCSASTRFADNEAYVLSRQAAMQGIAASEGVDLSANTKSGAPLPADATISWRKNVGFADSTGNPTPIDEGFRPFDHADLAFGAHKLALEAEDWATRAEALGLPLTDPDVVAARTAATEARTAADEAHVAAKPDMGAAKTERDKAETKLKDAKDAAEKARVTSTAASLPVVPPGVIPTGPVQGGPLLLEADTFAIQADEAARQAEALGLVGDPDVLAARAAATDARAAADLAKQKAVPPKALVKAKSDLAKTKKAEAEARAKAAEVTKGSALPPSTLVAPTDSFFDDTIEALDGVTGTITTLQWNPHMGRIVPAQHIPNGAGNWDQASGAYLPAGLPDVTVPL